MRGGIPQRAPGSKSLRDRLSTRQRVESRKNVRKPTGRPTSQNASKTRPNGSHQSSRPEGDPEKKPLGSTRPNGPSRRVPMKASARGSRLRPPTNQAVRGRDGDRPSRPLREGAQRGVPRFRKPNLPHPRNDRNQRYDNRRDQRNFNDRPYQSDAPGPENYGHQGQQQVHSTKDLLFKGPKKGCKYSEEDLKKIKVDIRPSLAEREANMFDQAELKKLKVDIKGENFDSKRGDVMYRDSHGVPYDKKVLESVKVNIKRKLGPEVMHQSHAIKRNLELDKFCVPPQYKEHQMLHSRPTFTHTSAGAKDYEKRDLSLKVNIVRQVPNPTNEPLRDEFHEDSFKMYRRQDVSPPRGNRKVIVEDRNRQFRENQEYHHDSRKFQTWQDEGSKPVFSNKNVAPNSVHLADIFPSERDRRESHSRPPPRLTHLDGPPQKFSDHDRDRQSRQRDREGELHNRRHPPPSKEPGHYGRSYSGKPYNLGSRALLPTPGVGKGQPLQSSDSRAGDYEMGRSLGGKDKYQRREPSPPPPPSLRPYDNYKPSDRPGRRSRSRSPLRRSPGKDSRDYPARTQQPFSTPRGSMAPSPRKRPLSPAPLEDKYRDRPFVDEKYRDKPFGDDKYRDKPFGDEKYRSDRPNLEEKYRSEKPIFDSYQDKPFGDEKYRDKPFGDDKYRDKPFGDDKYREKPFGDDKYREKPFGDDKYRDKPFGDDKFRDKSFGDDKYRDKPFGDDKFRDKSFGDDKFRDKPFGDDKYRDKPFGDDKYRSVGPNLEEKHRSEKSNFGTYREKPFGDDKYRSRSDHDRTDKAGPFGDKYRGDKPRSFETNYRAADVPVPYEDKYRPTEKPRSFEDNKLYRNDQPVPFGGDNYRTDKPYEDKYRTDKLGDNYREKLVAPYEDNKYRQDKLAPYNDKFRNDKTSHHYDDKYKSEKPAAPFQDNYRTDSRRSGGLADAKYDSGSRRELPHSSSTRVYSPSNGRGGERRRNSQDERRGGTSPRPPFSTDPKKNRDYYLKHSGLSGGGLGVAPGVGQESVGPMQLQMIPVISHPGVGMGVFSPFIRPLQHPVSSPSPSYNMHSMHTPYRPTRK